jgi:hypothetical protein
MTDDPHYVPAGEEWLGGYCVNPKCGLPILFYQVTEDQLEPDGSFVFRGDPPRLKCNHCGTEAVYQMEQLQLLQTVEKNKLS